MPCFILLKYNVRYVVMYEYYIPCKRSPPRRSAEIEKGNAVKAAAAKKYEVPVPVKRSVAPAR